MIIGERLKAARLTAGMSLRDVAQITGVSAMAISKYERGLIVPSSGVLLKLAQALDVKTEYFLRPTTVTLTSPSYRAKASLPRKAERAIVGRVREWVERYVEVESLFGAPERFILPNIERQVSSLDEVEAVALALRQVWSLGEGPIENLAEILEDRGIKVGLVEGHEDFDALTVWITNESADSLSPEYLAPVIVVKGDLPGDRQRFNMAHELGHLILQPVGDVDAEKAAYRFAGAFLVPEDAARSELGQNRHTLDFFELHLLKHKYGLSMQGWVYRAKDLRIISEAAAKRLFMHFRKMGWHRREPGDQLDSEKPERMKRLLVRALVEDMISRTRASELLGMPLHQFWMKEAEKHDGFPIGPRSGH